MRNLVALLLTASLIACGIGEKRENANSSASWTVDSVPTLDVGGVDTLETFGEVNGAARLADGGVVVADRMSSSLKYFDKNNNFVRAVGRNGDGPGEFGYISWMLHCADSLFVNDIVSRKITVFSMDGVYARQFAMKGDTIGQQPYASACSANGLFIHNGWDMNRKFPDKSGPMRGNVPYWTSTSNGEVLRRLGQHAWADRWVTIREGGGGGSGPLPMGRIPVIAASRSHFYVGTADSFHINVYALDGSAVAPILKPGTNRATQPADIERFKLLDSAGRRADENKYREQHWASLEFPKTLPAYTALIVDNQDNLWVRAYPPATGGVVDWTVFSNQGKEIAQLKLPDALTVLEIGNDFILGALTDVESGVTRVQVRSLKRNN